MGMLAPQGVDLFFDNVGGQMLDDALDHIAGSSCAARLPVQRVDFSAVGLPLVDQGQRRAHVGATWSEAMG